MTDPTLKDVLERVSKQIDGVCDQFESDWESGKAPAIEDFLSRVPVSSRDRLLRELLVAEWDLLRGRGTPPHPADYLRRFPDDCPLVEHAYRCWLTEETVKGQTAINDPSVPDGGIEQHTAALPSVSIPGYRVLEELGRGGMGVVYRAHDLKLKRDVALKMVLSGEYASEEEQARFMNEAAAVASLRHPHIVQVFEVNRHKSHLFMSLEYISGGSLAARLESGRLTALESAVLVERVTRAINVAHQAGFVHRDLKPANILLDTDGSPRVTDFGLAKHVQQDSGLTQTGTLLGTPSYMAPEQAVGDSNRVGPSADVYATGATLYACLTGVPPHKGSTPAETVRMVVEREPVAPRQLQPDVPRDLETICLKALNKDPARRYQSAAAMADDLQAWLTHRPISARPIGTLERTGKWCRRRPALAALLFVSVIAVVALMGGGIYFTSKLQAEYQTAVQLRIAAEVKRQEANAQRKRAEVGEAEARREAAKATAASDFLIGLFEDTEAWNLSGRTFGVLSKVNPSGREILDRGRKALLEDGTFDSDPVVQANLLHQLGKSYLSLGELDSAGPLLKKSLSMRTELLPAGHPDIAASLHANSVFTSMSEGFAVGIQQAQEALDLRREALGSEHPLTVETEFLLGALCSLSGRTEKAEPHLEHVATVQRKRLKAAQAEGSSSEGLITQSLVATLAFLADLHGRNQNPVRAMAYFTELKLLAGKVPDQKKAQVVLDLTDGYLFSSLSQFALADHSFRRAQATLEEMVGKDHFLRLHILQRHGYLLYEHERYREAEKVWKEHVRLVRKIAPHFHEIHAIGCYQTARSIIRGHSFDVRRDPVAWQKLIAESEPLAREAVRLCDAHLEEGELSATVQNFLGWLLQQKPDVDLTEVELLYERAWKTRCLTFGYDHLVSTEQLSSLISVLTSLGKYEKLSQCYAQHVAKLTDRQVWNMVGLYKLVNTAAALCNAGNETLALDLLQRAANHGLPPDALNRYRAFDRLVGTAEFEAVRIAAKKRSEGSGIGLLDQLKQRLLE